MELMLETFVAEVGGVELACDTLALVVFLWGMAAGAVLTYVPFAFRITTLRRRIEKLKSSLP